MFGEIEKPLVIATSRTPFHPPTMVTNIRNQISITLGTKTDHYTSRVALFKIQCTTCKVLDHMIPLKQNNRNMMLNGDVWMP